MKFQDLIDKEYINMIKKAKKLSMDTTGKNIADIAFMNEFDFTEEELKVLKNLLNDSFYHYEETYHDYNNGDWDYDPKADQYHEEQRYEIGKKIRLFCNKHIILSRINEISYEDISEQTIRYITRNWI